MLRVAIFGGVLLFAVTGTTGVVSAEPANLPTAETREAAAAAEDSPEAAPAVAAKSRRTGSRNVKKRGKFVGRVVAENQLRQEPLGLPSGDIEMRMLGLSEGVKVNIYNED